MVFLIGIIILLYIGIWIFVKFDDCEQKAYIENMGIKHKKQKSPYKW